MRFAVLFALVLLAACVPQRSAPKPEPAVLMTWPDLKERPLPAPTHTVQYGKGATEVADLWLPDGPGPHPVVVMVHGGCWQKQIADRTLMNYAAEALRAQDMAVWNIEYRGVDETGGGYPGTFQDVAQAADALRDVAAKHNLDLNRVAAYGHSAGGHLALWLAARPRLPATSPLHTAKPLRISTVLNIGGLADLKASALVTDPTCLASIMDTLTGPPSAARPDVFSDTSPAELLPLGLRQISVNGDRDRIAPAQLGHRYTGRAKAAGDPAETVVISNTGHVELIAPGTAAFDAEIALLKDALR